MSIRVLIIDDEDLFREDFGRLLRRRGYECRVAPNAQVGLALAEEFGPDVILCDIVMPGKGGIELLDELGAHCPESFVLMITAYGSVDTAVDAFRKGASDYIMKPVLIEDVVRKIERLMERKRLAQEVKFLRRTASRDAASLALVGEGEAMKKMLHLIEEVAPTHSTVLITGESGTGKELVGRAIDALSGSGERRFVGINCAGIPVQLLETELFGHVRGAFTGAVENRVGFFELAGEGTLFLDEIAEMPLALQSKLLRVLEQREFVPVGGTKAVALKARIIASTNKDLRELVQKGEFREDLFFRVAVFEINVPPLRERRSDVPLLVEHFVKRLSVSVKRHCLGVSNEAMQKLMSHRWPGNVRELRNVIERAMILCHRDYITPEHLPPEIRGASDQAPLSDSLRDATRAYEREHIRRVLEAADGNKEEAARRLGINPSTLYRKMADLGVGQRGA